MLENSNVTQQFSRVCVLGLGYIGLPTAAIIASKKIKVVGVDINADVVKTINQGKIHIVEPELDILVRAVVTDGFLSATDLPQKADVFLIAVPTPFTEEHQPDLNYIKAATNAIAPFLEVGNLVLLESTSPVGTTEQIAQWLAVCRPDLSFPHTHGDNSDIRIAYCPERVLPGHVVRELVQNDRVIGGITRKCAESAQNLYKIFVEGTCFISNARTAELCKLTENSFRDVNIAFANELSIICDKLNIDVWELIKLANQHPRVNILRPGPGVGGHCIAVDPWFIISQSPEESKLIKTARQVNDFKPYWVIEKIEHAKREVLFNNPQKKLKDITIACFGLSFKADIDDLRESPAIKIVQQLAEMHSGPIIVVEPHIEKLPSDLDKLVSLQTTEQALIESDIAVILVDHKSFRILPQSMFKNQKVVDTRGLWQNI